MRFLRDREERNNELQSDAGPDMFEPGNSPIGGVGEPAIPACLNDLEGTAAEACGLDELHSVILDVVDALVVVLDHEGRIIRFNRACEKATGYSFEEVAGAKAWDRLLLPEEAGPVEEVFKSLRSGEYPNSYENCWVTKDGGNRMIAWSNTAIPNPDGSVRYVIGTGLDVTDRRCTEDGLRWRTEDLMLLNTLNESANRGDDLHTIARLMSLGTKRSLSSHGAWLYLLDETRTHLILQDVNIPPGITKQIEKLLGVSLPTTVAIRLERCDSHREAVETGSPVFVTGNDAVNEMLRQFADASDVPAPLRTIALGLIPAIRKLLDLHSLALIPLISAGETVGLMSVGTSSELTDVQVGRLATIARQIAGIIRHRRSEENLLASEATLAEAQRIARIGNWSWDITRDERRWSEEVYRILGRGIDQCRPTYESFIEAVHPDDRDTVVAAQEKALR
ncbi:PAS domain S-box protein, partial [bacterium]|nr:PAS domain S-box protein [bacterium]